LREFFQTAPWWLLVLIWFGIFGALSLAARYVVRHLSPAGHRRGLADYAGKLLSPLGSTFAFLTGFAATMTWSAINAGQEAVDLQATSAQQLVWATKSISDKAGAAEILTNLRSYLNSEVNQDYPFLAEGDVTALPSAAAYDTLQHSVHNIAFLSGTTVPEAGAITSAAAALTAAQAKTTAVAQRSLPGLLIGLVIASGALVSLAMGTSSAEVYRPYLMYGWAFVSAIAVTLIITLDVPFSGSIAVSLAPLTQVAESLA